MKCKFCGDEFEGEYQAKQKYCSARCRKNWWLKLQKEENDSHKKEIPCKNCGKMFMQKRKDQHFCNKRCGNADYAKRRKVKSKCVQCGKEITSANKRKYCDECRENWRECKGVIKGTICKTIRNDIKLLNEINAHNKTHKELWEATPGKHQKQLARLLEDGFIDIIGKGLHRQCGLTISGIMLLEGENG